MKPHPLLLLIGLLFALSSCKVNRYQYLLEEPIGLYAFPSYQGEPIQRLTTGDTVWATNAPRSQLGGPVPVEYRGYRLYSPSVRARLIGSRRVRPRQARVLSGLVYESRLRAAASAEPSTLPANYSYTPSTGATIHTGPRGGRYYINSRGNKTYVPRSGSSSSSSGSSYRSRSTGSYRSSGSGYRSSSGSRGRH